jgi:hypothetical protein
VCSLCAALGASRNWTDAAGKDAFRRHGGKVTVRQEREARVALLNLLLAPSGLRIRDWGGNSYMLQTQDGRRENVYNLHGIWAAVDALIPGGCDPLDPRLLDALANSRPGDRADQ